VTRVHAADLFWLQKTQPRMPRIEDGFTQNPRWSLVWIRTRRNRAGFV